MLFFPTIMPICTVMAHRRYFFLTQPIEKMISVDQVEQRLADSAYDPSLATSNRYN